ncbi:reverse transcriptase domain-containing protein [Tanacetum coccineum]
MFSCDLRKWHQEEGPQEPRGQGIHHNSPTSQQTLLTTTSSPVPNCRAILTKVLRLHWQAREQPGMVMIAILREALRELLDLPDGLRRWSLCHIRQLYNSLLNAIMATLKKKMTDKYCPRGEIKKIEAEMWNLKVKGTDVVAYNRRFQQLALMCARMFPEESDQIERYIGGLPDMILGSVKCIKIKRQMQDVIEITIRVNGGQTKGPMLNVLADNKKKSEDFAPKQPIHCNKQEAEHRRPTRRVIVTGDIRRT